jgi:hypothetical protein
MKKKNPYNWLRWIARITGILIVVFTLIMVIGEFMEGRQRHAGTVQTSYTPIIMMIFVVWGIALCGLVLALWKEGLGGIISLAGFLLTYVMNLFNKEASMKGSAITVFLIFSIPSILYLIYWKLNRDDLRPKDIIKTEELT